MAVSFKGAHFPKDIILTGVRWYLAYPLSTRHRSGEIVEALWPERQISLPPFVQPGLTALHGAADVRDALASHAESDRRLAFRQCIVHHRLFA